MKTLLTNGCSWTYGGGLDFTEEQLERLPYIVWPYKLKELMQYDNCVNLAAGCGSNQRIVRTTFNWLQKQSKETLQNTIAVIQWTELSRYEYYYDSTNNSYDDIEHNWALVKAGVVLTNERVKVYGTLLKKAMRRYETYTEIEGLYAHLTHLETLHSLFNYYGVKYYYWNFTMDYSEGHPLLSYMLSKFNWLEPDGHHSWDYDRIGDHDPHPNEIGHKQIAEHIFNVIK